MIAWDGLPTWDAPPHALPEEAHTAATNAGHAESGVQWCQHLPTSSSVREDSVVPHPPLWCGAREFATMETSSRWNLLWGASLDDLIAKTLSRKSSWSRGSRWWMWWVKGNVSEVAGSATRGAPSSWIRRRRGQIDKVGAPLLKVKVIPLSGFSILQTVPWFVGVSSFFFVSTCKCYGDFQAYATKCFS
jgi:hypothetical protein